jgi:hypothetical protein
MTLLVIVAVGLEATLSSGIFGTRVARQRTLAEQVASEQVETIRRLDYDDVGTVGGNPAGVLATPQNLTVSGFRLTMRTRVQFVDDPIPGGYVTRANYKRVLVILTETGTTRELARHETYVAPPTQPPRNRAVIRAQVVDFALSAGVPDVTVSLEAGPSAPRSDTSELDGTVTFAQLVANPLSGPQAYYDLRATASGYQTLREDVPPGPAAHAQLAVGQVFTTSLRIYRPAVVTVRLTDSSGNPYTNPATVTIASSRGAQSFAVTGGTLVVTQIAGEYVVPGLTYTAAASATGGRFSQAVAKSVPNNYPTDLTSTFDLQLLTYTTAGLTVRVRASNGTTPVPGARVDVSGGPASTFLSGTTNSSGNVSFTVPRGATPTYSIAASGTGNWGSGSTVAAVPGPSSTTAQVNLSGSGP